MNPRKARASYETISNIINIPIEHVQSINSFYWKDIRTNCSELVNPIITLIGLGQMEIKTWNIDDTICKLTNKVRRWNSTNTEAPIFKSYTTDLNRITAMKTMVEIEKQKALENKIKRREYEDK